MVYSIEFFVIKVCIYNLSRFQQFKINNLTTTPPNAEASIWDVILALQYFVIIHLERASNFYILDYQIGATFLLQWSSDQETVLYGTVEAVCCMFGSFGFGLFGQIMGDPNTCSSYFFNLLQLYLWLCHRHIFA